MINLLGGEMFQKTHQISLLLVCEPHFCFLGLLLVKRIADVFHGGKWYVPTLMAKHCILLVNHFQRAVSICGYYKNNGLRIICLGSS